MNRRGALRMCVRLFIVFSASCARAVTSMQGAIADVGDGVAYKTTIQFCRRSVMPCARVIAFMHCVFEESCVRQVAPAKVQLFCREADILAGRHTKI